MHSFKASPSCLIVIHVYSIRVREASAVWA
jgi:hypothetical protein